MCDKVLQIEVFLSSNISGLTIRCLCCAHRTNCQWGNSWNLRVSWERSTGILSNWLQLGCLLLGCCSKAAEDWTSDRWEWLGFPTPTFSPSPRVQGRGVWADLRRAALWAPSARDRTAWTWRVPTPTTSCSWSTKCGGLQMCCSTSRKLLTSRVSVRSHSVDEKSLLLLLTCCGVNFSFGFMATNLSLSFLDRGKGVYLP